VPADNELQAKYDELRAKYQELEAKYQKAERALEIRDIELKAVLAQANEITNTDVLTFLPNRRKIINDLQEEVIRSNRYGTSLSISILDIDHFKNVNDTYGHTTGDETLRSVAARLRDHIRQPDTIGRYGGEEFLIVLPSSEVQAAAEQAARLCQHVRMMKIEANDHVLSDWEQFLHRADEALYKAKNDGRDRWAVAEE